MPDTKTPAPVAADRCGITLAGGGGPCQAPAGHEGRGRDLTGQPWSHAYVAPCRRCGSPHPTAADRSACPWTDQPAAGPIPGSFHDPRVTCCGRDAADCDCADLAEALTFATGGTVHRLTADGPACGIDADDSAAWLAVDLDPARVTCPACLAPAVPAVEQLRAGTLTGPARVLFGEQ